MFLTGPIPRESGEDCGGHFFFDEACTMPNPLREEQALLVSSGVLITGCCHAGIVNTAETCRRARPDIAIRAIVGGLHLRHAGKERLERTAAYLATLGLECLVLMHCTGGGCGGISSHQPCLRGRHTSRLAQDQSVKTCSIKAIRLAFSRFSSA